jgi:DNA-binding NtrC family response regulator
MSGLELLTWIKGQTELAGIPVVVMSTTGDTEQAISRGASEYLDKTPNYKSLIGILEALCS